MCSPVLYPLVRYVVKPIHPIQTICAMQSFLYAMVLYPECQKRAQAELDAFIGPDRHPTAADRSKLPYLEAMWKETLRWNPVVPLAMPHMTREEDEYKGYFVPKGVMIHPNIMYVLFLVL
jgi:cytochrome P450